MDRKLVNAIIFLIRKYDEAKNNPVVNNPLGYALYHTWKVFDEEFRKMRRSKG